MEIDQKTGLPKLPDNYRWSVVEGSRSDVLEVRLEVGIMRNLGVFKGRLQWIPTQVEPLYVYWNDEPLGDLIKEVAVEIWRDWNRRREVQGFIGSYPPNSVEGD